MSYTVEHVYIDLVDGVRIEKQNDWKRASYSGRGDFAIRHPGPLSVVASGSYTIHMTVDTSGPGGPVHTTRPKTQVVTFPISVRIFSPDGLEFTAREVTPDDLTRFRDLRSVSQGSWRYEASGVSDTIYVTDKDGSVTPSGAYINISLQETVPSQSAGVLVDASIGPIGTEVFQFDLFRVGQFQAWVQTNSVLELWVGTLMLKDPDGNVAASGSNISFPVTLRTLDKSRDAAGGVRLWSLEVHAHIQFSAGGTLKATVIATTRIPTSILQSRIDDLIGVGGSKLRIYGENKNGRALARLQILDPYSAETIDMHHLLDKVIGNTAQDPGVSTSSIEAFTVYNIANRSESLGSDLSIDVGSLRVTQIKATIGASQHIQPSIPAVTVEVDVQGQVYINLGFFELATVSLNNNQIILEAGATTDGSGNIVTSSWMSDSPINLDISWGAAVLAGILTGPLILLGLDGVTKLIQSQVNDAITSKFQSIVEGAIFQAPFIMAMLLGADFTLTSFRMEEDAIVIDYVAPVEPDPKPNPNYLGIIGRSAIQLGRRAWEIFPRSLGNTWAAGNLAKVDHIVVVMMENRSFDHVMGYRGLLAGAQGEEGWSNDLITFLTGFTVPKLSDSTIQPNASGLKTRFPYSVGHALADVAQQLSARLQLPTGGQINSPQGFLDDFKKEVGSDNFDLNNVLGYYDANDLVFYGYLAENYGYCERYFAAHPGPTLPNRMYSLSGDVQYDRVGEAILDNNNADNFSLSRALNIFDLLTRKGVSWRVYESFPSVTMLRMFARYAPDNTNIVPISGLERDISAGNLPSVTFIDPAMHHAPENDDHPPFADMLSGQIFLRRVYDALRLNDAIWAKTLLIVTYDEHGGFYDHVVPPLADALSLPLVLTQGGAQGPPVPSFKADMTINYGLRVPTFVVSPFVPAGKGPDIPLDHCSILKTILARFCGDTKPFLTDRVNASHTFDSFLTLPGPRTVSTLPKLPTVATPRLAPGARTIVTKPMTRATMQGDVDFHDLTGMLARMLGRH